MWRKIILWIVEKLYPFTYEPVTLDKVNGKLIRPVPGLIIEGKQYYEFVSVADMPEARRTHFSYMREETIMGIDRELQFNIINKLKEANQANDVNQIGHILFMWEDTLKNITTVENLYNIASLAYFDRQEDLANYDLDYAQQKIKLFKSVENKGFFFSRLLQETLKVSSESLLHDIEELLKVNAVKLQVYRQQMSSGATDLEK